MCQTCNDNYNWNHCTECVIANHPVRVEVVNIVPQIFAKERRGKRYSQISRPKAACSVIGRKWDLNKNCRSGKILSEQPDDVSLKRVVFGVQLHKRWFAPSLPTTIPIPGVRTVPPLTIYQLADTSCPTESWELGNPRPRPAPTRSK